MQNNIFRKPTSAGHFLAVVSFNSCQFGVEPIETEQREPALVDLFHNLDFKSNSIINIKRLLLLDIMDIEDSKLLNFVLRFLPQ